MDDLISRQAAIDAVRKCSVKEVTSAFMLVDKAEVMTELMILPSAQPELATDYISKQSVIDAITDENIIRNMDSVMDSEMHRVKRSVHRIIASMPSAQPDASDCVLELYGECSYAETGCSDCKIKNEIHNAFVKAAQYDWMIKSIIQHGVIGTEREWGERREDG